jgi:hypothetical protein
MPRRAASEHGEVLSKIGSVDRSALASCLSAFRYGSRCPPTATGASRMATVETAFGQFLGCEQSVSKRCACRDRRLAFPAPSSWLRRRSCTAMNDSPGTDHAGLFQKPTSLSAHGWGPSRLVAVLPAVRSPLRRAAGWAQRLTRAGAQSTLSADDGIGRSGDHVDAAGQLFAEAGSDWFFHTPTGRNRDRRKDRATGEAATPQ